MAGKFITFSESEINEMKRQDDLKGEAASNLERFLREINNNPEIYMFFEKRDLFGEDMYYCFNSELPPKVAAWARDMTGDDGLPLLIFDYCGYQKGEGFVISGEWFYYKDTMESNVYKKKLSSIKRVHFKKHLLASVMLIEDESGIDGRKIYLTGIDNPKKFVEVFNEYLVEKNG